MGEGRKPPVSLPISTEEGAKLYATMSAFDGTYKIEGETNFVVHVENSWAPSWSGTDQHRTFRIDGNNLTITFVTKAPGTGQDLSVTVRGERLE